MQSVGASKRKVKELVDRLDRDRQRDEAQDRRSPLQRRRRTHKNAEHKDASRRRSRSPREARGRVEPQGASAQKSKSRRIALPSSSVAETSEGAALEDCASRASPAVAEAAERKPQKVRRRKKRRREAASSAVIAEAFQPSAVAETSGRKAAASAKVFPNPTYRFLPRERETSESAPTVRTLYPSVVRGRSTRKGSPQRVGSARRQKQGRAEQRGSPRRTHGSKSAVAEHQEASATATGGEAARSARKPRSRAAPESSAAAREVAHGSKSAVAAICIDSGAEDSEVARVETMWRSEKAGVKKKSHSELDNIAPAASAMEKDSRPTASLREASAVAEKPRDDSSSSVSSSSARHWRRRHRDPRPRQHEETSMSPAGGGSQTAPMPNYYGQGRQRPQFRGSPWTRGQGWHNWHAGTSSGACWPQPWNWLSWLPVPQHPSPSPSQPLASEPPQSAVAVGIGSMSCVYAYVGAEADIDRVAGDLRNQAPWVLIVCCSDDDAAMQMDTALRREAVEQKTCGDGGSRKSMEDLQVSFHVVKFKHLIVARRCPVVKELEIKETFDTPGGGVALIAELGLHVMVQGQLSIRIAAFDTRKIRGGGEWDEVADSLAHRSVRLVAGEFGDTLLRLLATIRKRMAIKVCAMTLCTDKEDGTTLIQTDGPMEALKVTPSAMLVAGPVSRLTMLQSRGSGGSSETRGGGVNVIASFNAQSYVGEKGKDASRGWPYIENVKQKEVKTVLPHTRKLLVFLGSNTSHRTQEAREARAHKRTERASACQDKAWAQPYRQRTESDY